MNTPAGNCSKLNHLEVSFMRPELSVESRFGPAPGAEALPQATTEARIHALESASGDAAKVDEVVCCQAHSSFTNVEEAAR